MPLARRLRQATFGQYRSGFGVLPDMALGAVAVGGKRASANRVAIGAGVPGGFRGAMQRFLVVERRSGLRKNLRMAGGAVAVHAVIVLLMRKADVPVRRLDQ